MANVTLDWLHVAILLGAVQGVFLALMLATQRRNRIANRLLAVAMLVFSVSLASNVYYAAGLERAFPHFFGVSYALPLLYGPLIYLYAVSAADRTRPFRWRDAVHFVPFVVVIILALPIYLMSGLEKIEFYHGLQRGEIPLLLRVVDPLKYVSGIGYAIATILFLRLHEARVKDSYSTIERVNLQWVIRLALAAAAIWALATAFLLLEPVNEALAARGDDAVALAMAILVYWIGYKALRQPEIFAFAAVDHRPTPPEPAPVPPSAAPSPPPAATSEPAAAAATVRYERSGLTDREAAALERALLHVMETERPYRNSELTLADLAERLDTTPHKLSEVLNSQLEQTFYDFVNAYRVRDVQQRIADQRWQHLKILALAMDAGFASKSTFNHVFRKHTGHTPSAYRRSVTA